MNRKLAVACIALFSFGAIAAHADTVTFVGTGSGSDGSLAANAIVTTSSGQVQITLTNTLAASAFRSAGQALSDFSFTLGNLTSGPGTLGATSATGQMGNISSTGGVSYTTGSPTRFLGANGQGALTVTGNTILLEAIGGGQPSEMIAPSVANGAIFTSANQGVQNFDAYVIGPASFTLFLPNVTAATTITSGSFSFGTGPDTTIAVTPRSTPAVPEPSSIAQLGTALLGAAGIMKRRLS